jgi:hypothetical protein
MLWSAARARRAKGVSSNRSQLGAITMVTRYSVGSARRLSRCSSALAEKNNVAAARPRHKTSAKASKDDSTRALIVGTSVSSLNYYVIHGFPNARRSKPLFAWGFGADRSSKARFETQATGNNRADDKGVIMRRRTLVTEDPAPVAETGYVAERRTAEATMPPWSPLQIIGLIVGIGFGVLGIAAVARTGFDTSHIYTPHDLVWSFPHSPLLGVIEIGFGLLMVLGSVVPGGWRSFLALLGAIALAFGIVVLVEELPNRLNDWLAVSHRNGWLYVAAGGIVLLAALFAPIFGGVEREHRVLHRETVLN